MTDIVREGAPFPAWCEVKSFSQINLAAGETAGLAVAGSTGRLLVTLGSLQCRQTGRSQVLREGQFMELGAGGLTLVGGGNSSQAVLFDGGWGTELGGCGLFRAENVPSPADRGDPVSYPKHTNIDAHYHDCDEYWVVLEGRPGVVVDGRHSTMRPGDCLLIPMGAMHDMPDAPEPVKAVYFESSLRGRKRTGHLWQHTHGPAVMENKAS
jgi:mannose-6-phosphate isomerase-like protein (cupin superfamily)